MQRLPLSSPAHAAALVAVGFPASGLRLEALNHTGTGEKKTGWFFESPLAADAADLIKRSRPDHPKALWRAAPAHPFLAALAGVENLAALQAWFDDPAGTPPAGILHRGEKLMLLKSTAHHPSDLGAAPPDMLRALFGVPMFFQTNDLSFAAALCAVGFVPAPRILAAGSLQFPERSHLHPDLTASMAAEASTRLLNGELAPFPLPGFPPQQHPFQYAFSAVRNLITAPGAEAAVWKKPTHFFPGVKSALANDAALNRPGFEKKILDHIAGV